MGIEVAILGTIVSINLAQIAAAAVVSIGLALAQRQLFKPDKPNLGAFQPRGAGEIAKSQLNVVDAAPELRYVYGYARIGGSVSERRVAGKNLVLCIHLNSRESEGPFKVFLDNREVALEGDPFDFAGDGAVAVADEELPGSDLYAGFVNIWIGRGEQTAVPDFLLDQDPRLAEASPLAGYTCIWLLCNRGDPAREGDRWPNAVPTVLVEGKWSKIFDPRDPAQDVDDPASWAWSENQALCTLDMVRHEHCIDAPDGWHAPSFIAGADVADIQTPILGGETEPLYRLAGIWYTDGKTPFENIEPCLNAGMSDLVEVDGLWRFVPGRYQAPEIAFDETIFKGEAASFRNERDPSEMFNQVDVLYVEPDRNWELQPLDTITDPAALASDGDIPSTLSLRLDWVPYASQAFRMAWRSIQLTRCEREVRSEFGAEAVVMHAGATCSIDCATVFGGVIEFRVTSWSIALEPVDQDLGTTRLSVSMELAEHSPKIDLYDPEAQQVLDPIIEDEPLQALAPPVIVSVTPSLVATPAAQLIYADLVIGQSPSASVRSYQARFRQPGEPFLTLPEINVADLEDGEDFTVRAGPLALSEYEFQIRARSDNGLSDYAAHEFTISSPTDPAAPPVALDESGDDHIVRFQIPVDPAVEGIRVYREVVPPPQEQSAGEFVVATASVISGQVFVHVGSGPEDTAVNYRATTLDIWGNESAFSNISVHTTNADDGGTGGGGTAEGTGSGGEGGDGGEGSGPGGNGGV